MHILVVKASALGDIIQAFPVAHYLHRLYPHAKIDWVVEEPFKEIVEAHPLINRTLIIRTKKWRSQLWNKTTWEEIRTFNRILKAVHYDFILDLQGNVKSSFVLALAKSGVKVGFGYRTVPEKLNVLFTHKRFNPPADRNIRKDYLFLAQSMCGDFDEGFSQITLKTSSEEEQKVQKILTDPFLQDCLVTLICPGSNWPNKQLSDETLETFLSQMHEQLKAHYIFVWGSQEEKKRVERLAVLFEGKCLIADRLSLPALQLLMSKVNLIVAMDSLPLHLAGTTSTPTFSFFGPSLAYKYKPLGIHHHAFQGSCPYDKQFKKRCPALRSCSTGACLKHQSNQALFSHFMNWWKSYSKLSNS